MLLLWYVKSGYCELKGLQNILVYKNACWVVFFVTTVVHVYKPIISGKQNIFKKNLKILECLKTLIGSFSLFSIISAHRSLEYKFMCL